MGAWVNYGLGSELQKPTRLCRDQWRFSSAGGLDVLAVDFPSPVPGFGVQPRAAASQPFSGRTGTDRQQRRKLDLFGHTGQLSVKQFGPTRQSRIGDSAITNLPLLDAKMALPES